MLLYIQLCYVTKLSSICLVPLYRKRVDTLEAEIKEYKTALAGWETQFSDMEQK